MRLALAALALVMILPACSSSTEEARGGVTTTIDRAKLMESLSASEAETLCKDVRAWSDAQFTDDEARRAPCNLIGALYAKSAKGDAEAQAECQTRVDACLADPLFEWGTTDACGVGNARAQRCASTGVTVGEIVSCQEETLAGARRLVAVDFCSTLTLSEVNEMPARQRPKCELAESKCSAFFE